MSETKDFEVDTLVIGGGVQGLMVSYELRRHGYSVLLLEKNKLGGGQTCHSHVFIHDGHLCRKPSLMHDFREGRERWRKLLGPSLLTASESNIVVGFDDEIDAAEQQAIWESLNPPLESSSQTIPSEFGLSCLRAAFKAPVQTLTSEDVLDALMGGAAGSIAKVDEVERMEQEAKQIVKVSVQFAGGKRAVIRPRTVVLAAGYRNQDLLCDLIGNSSASAQWSRTANLLILRGRGSAELPSLGGHFLVRGNGIAIAPRRLNDRNIWLISDSRIPVLEAQSASQFQWFQNLFEDLRSLAPSLFANPENWYWGIHKAAKAEGWDAYRWPYSARIETFGLKSFWTLWPTFLTLAPLLSTTVCEYIQKQIGLPSKRSFPAQPFWPAPDRSQECWKQHLLRGGLHSWAEIRATLEFIDDPQQQDDHISGTS